jgi:hypothetical protein
MKIMLLIKCFLEQFRVIDRLNVMIEGWVAFSPGLILSIQLPDSVSFTLFVA